MTPFVFVCAALATLRLSLIVTQEEGPFSLFTRLRGRLDPEQKTWLGRGLSCVWCVSFWVAWPVLALTFDPWGLLIVQGLALSGAVVLLKRWMDKGR